MKKSNNIKCWRERGEMENSILENNLAVISEVNMCRIYDQETLLLKIYSRVFSAYLHQGTYTRNS